MFRTFCFAAGSSLLAAMAVSANAQTVPIGTWQGTFLGTDTGTITISIDANQKVTAVMASDNYGAHFVLQGGLQVCPSVCSFTISSGNGFPSWTGNGQAISGQPIANGIWISSDLAGNGSGSYTANFMSAIPDYLFGSGFE